MSLIYTWKLTAIRKADTPDLSGVVIGTRWECTGADENGDSGTFSGATPFNLNEVNSETFVPFEELTEELVLGWVQAVVVDGYKDHIDSQIMKQIAQKKSIVVELSGDQLPWAAPASNENI